MCRCKAQFGQSLTTQGFTSRWTLKWTCFQWKSQNLWLRHNNWEWLFKCRFNLNLKTVFVAARPCRGWSSLFCLPEKWHHGEQTKMIKILFYKLIIIIMLMMEMMVVVVLTRLTHNLSYAVRLHWHPQWRDKGKLGSAQKPQLQTYHK